jgi:hypothetical protein
MRGLILLLSGAAACLAAACSTPAPDAGQPASVEVGSNDCAVLVAIAKEHYKFGPDNPPPPLKGLGESGWRPQCSWAAHGLSFADYSDVPQNPDNPRERLRWVAFQQPTYDGNGAAVATEIMHGPLAGIGYECRVHSGFAGWTVGECRVSWVS